MLLLFEIVQRKVNQEGGNDEQRALDKLPIASFIACAIELHGRNGFNFVDIFDDDREITFHCYKGKSEDRKRNLMELITPICECIWQRSSLG